jgi:hypothetical protein
MIPQHLIPTEFSSLPSRPSTDIPTTPGSQTQVFDYQTPEDYKIKEIKLGVSYPKSSSLDLDTMFARHTPTPSQQRAMNELRDSLMLVAKLVVHSAPSGPNQTLAIRHLEDALMRANKAIVEGK